jgi:WD40 repeat protein
VAVNPPEHLLSQLKDGPRGLLRAVQRVLPADESVELVLVIDQFEEVFTLVEDEAERALLLESLATVVLDERSRLRAVITLRADFTDKPLRYVDFGELIDRRFEFVLPLTADEVERAVAGPAQRAGLRLEKGLVSTIIREAGDQPGTLPLLQHAMAELFERRERRTLTLKVYHEIGGVLGALGRTAEAIYDGLDEAGMAAARQVFLRLVTLGEGAEDTRRRVLLSEIEALFGDEQASVGNVLEAYGKARLLTFDRDPLTRGATVEVAHEALLREWGRLGEWLDESRSDVRLQRQLAAAAAEWGAGGNDASFLFTGSRLGQFAGWAASTTIALTPDERAFLEAGIAERDRREQEEQARQQRELEAAQKLAEEQSRRADEQAHAAGRLRRRAYLLAGAFALAILLAGVAAFFGNQANRNAAAAQESALSAQENADQALQNAAAAQNAQATAQAERGRADQAARVASSRELAAQSALKLEKDPELSMLLALAAYDASPSKEAVDALHQAVDTSRLIMTIKAQDSAIAWNNVIVDLAMSPDGKRFASASAGDKPLKIWDTATGALLMTLAVTLAGPTDWVQAVRFSPDGTLLASASAGGTVEVWDLSTGSERFAIRTEQPPNSVDFSPDGAWLISAAGRTQIGFWDTRTGVQLFALSSPDWVAGTTPLEAMSEALSADGTRMAIYLCTAARTYCRVEIWNVSARQRERILFTTSEQLALDRNHGMSFGPDGSRLAIVRTEVVFGPGSVWDVNSGQKLYNLGSGLNKVVFSADGGYLFSATGGGTASIWDAATGRQLVSLAGHQSRVEAIAVNSNCPQWSSLGWCGTRLISGDDDGNVKIWDITPGGRGEGLVVPGAPFSVDGDWSHLTTAGARQVGKDKNAVTFWRWTIPTWAQDGLSHLPAPDTFSVEFPADSPVADVEGGFFLNVAKDGRITLLDTATPGGSQSLGCCFETSDNSLSSTTRSVSANLLAIAGTNGIVQFWDTASGRQLQNLRAQQPDEIDPSGINSIGPMALSSDGKRLATVSSDSGDTKIWDLATRRMLLTLPGELHPSHAAFSPDGRLIAIAHCGGFISVWDARTGNIKIRLLGHTACISPITFSPDGTRLASTSADRTLRIWDLQTAGELLTISMGGPGTLPGGGAGLTALAFSPDDKMLLASVAYNGGTDVDTRSFLLEPEALVALAKSRLTRGFTTDECQRYLHMDVCPPEP